MACPLRSGAAASDKEAERACEALRNSGVILRVNNLVYLRPQEVTEMIMRVGNMVPGPALIPLLPMSVIELWR